MSPLPFDSGAVSRTAFTRSARSGEGIHIEFSVLGDTQVSRKMLRFGDHAMAAEALWESLYEDFLQIEEEQFDTEGKHGSGGWAPLAPRTVAEKIRKGQDPAIEKATTDLFQSLARRDGPGQIFINNVTWMVFGTSLPHAKFQQHGTSKMPQRRVVEFTETERVWILKKIQTFIVTGQVEAL